MTLSAAVLGQIRMFTVKIISRAHDIPLTAVHMNVTESYERISDGNENHHPR